jgi:hypothetical protein
MKHQKKTAVALALIFSSLILNTVSAADLSRSEVQQLLKKSSKENPANLRRKDLKGIDLSNPVLIEPVLLQTSFLLTRVDPGRFLLALTLRQVRREPLFLHHLE